MNLNRLIFTLFLFSTSQFIGSAQTSDINEGCLPLTVNFTAPGGSSTFFWDFDDGAFSTEQNPSRIFTAAGTYDVTFAESSGGAIIGTITIDVYPQPDIMIGANQTIGCAPLAVQFADNTIINSNVNIVSWQWTFGDGNSSSSSAPNYTYENAGNYTVSLSLETNLESCNAIEGFNNFITVDNAPVVSFTTNPSPASACEAPLNVNFTNNTVGSGLTYMWDFGNGNTSTEMNPPAQDYTEEGDFPVTLTVTNTNNCSETFTSPVSVGSPTADFVIPETVCLGATIATLNTSSAGNYLWNFGPGVTPSVSTLANPVVQFGTIGPQTVTLTVTSPDGQCSDEINRVINVEDVDLGFTATPTWSCTEPLVVVFTPNNLNATSYMWDFGDGQTSTEVSPTHEFLNPDQTIYGINGEIIFETTLTIESDAGCSGTFTVSDTLNQPNALFRPDISDGCAPVAVTFMDESSGPRPFVSWEYQYGDGNSQVFTNNDDHTYTYNNPGEYEVTLIVTNSEGCTDTSYTQLIEVGEPITPNFSVDNTVVCPGDTVQFTDLTNNSNIDAWHFSTDNNRSFHCYNENELFYAFDDETGPQDVTLFVEYNGCVDSLVMEDLITVNGPIAHIDYMVDCDNPFDVMFSDSSDDATAIIWDFGDLVTSTANDPVNTYAATGDYQVVLMAENPGTGCPASYDTTTVFVREIQSEFILDTILCFGLPYDLNAEPSVDVQADCWKGYTWEFTQGRPITTQETVTEYFFMAPGRQKVFLTTTDINGCEDFSELTVTVYMNTPEFAVSDDEICFPSTVNFTDMTTGDTTIVSWMWDFGDMNTSEDQNTSNLYNMGTDPITVTLSVEDILGCPGSTTQDINVYTPVSTISSMPFPANLCVGESVDFAASDFTEQGSNLNFGWDFGNGATSTNQEETATYLSGGTFEVVLDYVEIATGCRGTTVDTVRVQDFPMADFTTSVDGEPLVCFPENIEFTDNSTGDSGLTYMWDFGNGITSTDPDATIFYENKGTYTITEIVSTTFGCSDTTSSTVTLVGPEGDYTVDTDFICKGESITFTLIDTVDIGSWEWDFGDGVVESNVSPVTHQYDSIFAGGNIPAVLNLVGQNGVCETAIPILVSVNEVVANFTTNTGGNSSCVGELTFVNTSLNSDIFNWDFGNGNTSTESNPTTLYSEAGVYTVTLSVENSTAGCTDEISQQITISDMPTVAVNADNVCFGSVTDLEISSPSAGSVYTWSPANLLTTDTGPSVTTVPLQNTSTFTVDEVDINGCTATASFEIVVVPNINLMSDTVATCANDPVMLSIEKPEEYTFNWTSAQDPQLSGLSCQDCSNPVVMTNSSAVYTVRATHPFGPIVCGNNAADFTLNVVTGDFEYPLAFTPDGDGINDYFNYVLIGDSDELNTQVTTLKIYNRWGELVYDNDDPSQGWGGMHGGKPAASDVYLWIMEVNIEGCVADSQQGSVTLIR